MKVAIYLVISLSIFQSSFCQKTPKAFVDHFFEVYRDKPEQAVSGLISNNKWLASAHDEMDTLIQQLTGLTRVLGKYHGFELTSEKHLGANLVLFGYLVRYDRQPLRFFFSFYKPGDEWIPYTFSFDLDFMQELKGEPNSNKIP